MKCWSESNSISRIRWSLDADDNVTDAGDNDRSIFVLIILEKIKETRLKFSQGCVTVL